MFLTREFLLVLKQQNQQESFIFKSELTNEQIIENVATAYYQVFVQEENLKTVEESYANTEK
jgi:outer membrane protein TolC